MVRKILILGVVVLCLSFPTWAHAATLQKGSVELSAIAGAAIPIGSLGDAANTGFSVGGALGYYFSPRGSIGGSVVVNLHGVDSEISEPGIDTSISLTEVTGYWKAIFSSSQSVQPYARVMGGLIVTKVSASVEVQGVEVSASASESDFGIGAGFGVQFQSQGAVGGFTEFMLFTGFTEGDASNYIGIRGGVNFTFTTSQ
jgi:hypothetical protein